MDIPTLTAAIRNSWAAETSDHADTWSADNPAKGQCAVTSMVVRDHLGGSLLIAPVYRDGEQVEMHCWNVLPDGTHLDLTVDQFDYDFALGEPVEREPIVNHTGVDRHQLLAARVKEALGTTLMGGDGAVAHS